MNELREILPGQSVTMSAHAADVAPLFRVTEEVAVNPRTAEPAGAEVIPPAQARAAVTVWAMPWPELVILVLVLAAVWWSWWRRRQQRRQAATLMDEAMAKAREEVRRELQQESSTPTD